MARDAILSVKEAEQEVKEMVEEAVLAAKNSKEEMTTKAEEEHNRIVNEAEINAKAIKDDARKEGETAAKPILEKGQSDAEVITNISDADLGKAVNIIIERIVNADGNS